MPNTITATPSYFQDQLSRDIYFRKRLQQHLMRQALVVMAEPVATPNHAERLTLAKNVVADGAESFVNRMSFVLVNHANLNNSVSIVDGVVATAVTDANLLAAVADMWNTLSGVPSGA